MKTLVFSGYEPLNRAELPPIFTRISSYQKRWADSIGADYIYNTTDLISKYMDHISHAVLRTRKISEDTGFSKNTRQGAVYADISRVMWIRDLLKDYDQICWLDGDLLPLKNFQMDLSPHPSPSMLFELMMSSIDPESKSAKYYGKSKTVTVMRFTKDHLPYLDAHIQVALAIAAGNSAIEKKDWWIMGTSLVSALHELYQYRLIYGIGFVTKKTLGEIYNSLENTKLYFELYKRDVWDRHGNCEVQGMNLSTNQDVDKLEMWIDLLDSNDYLLKV